jgi:hypothetical protein
MATYRTCIPEQLWAHACSDPTARAAGGAEDLPTTVILRPTRSARLSFSVFPIAIGAFVFGLGLRDWIGHGWDLWIPGVIALSLAALGVAFWISYLQADDTSIVVSFMVTRRYDRRVVAAIAIGALQIGYYTGSGRRVRFLRSDGSTLFVTAQYFWGNDQLRALATYLGVPIGRS